MLARRIPSKALSSVSFPPGRELLHAELNGGVLTRFELQLFKSLTSKSGAIGPRQTIYRSFMQPLFSCHGIADSNRPKMVRKGLPQQRSFEQPGSFCL